MKEPLHRHRSRSCLHSMPNLTSPRYLLRHCQPNRVLQTVRKRIQRTQGVQATRRHMQSLSVLPFQMLLGSSIYRTRRGRFYYVEGPAAAERQPNRTFQPTRGHLSQYVEQKRCCLPQFPLPIPRSLSPSPAKTKRCRSIWLCSLRLRPRPW